MSENPLKSYFRQPKIYISLVTKGIYNKPGTIKGDATNLAVYGMTGMDEIIYKTPDALMTGEASVQVIKSCVPDIVDPWDLSVIDADLVFSSIRIATYGNTMSIAKDCDNCGEENEYDLDLAFVIDHFNSVKYNNKIYVDDFIIHTRPITYKQLTEFNLRNFEMQQKLKQADAVKDETEKQQFINQVWKDLAEAQQRLALLSVESVEVGGKTVTDKAFIAEWLENSDQKITDAIQNHILNNRQAWSMPKHKIKCSSCGHEGEITLDLDQSNFFAVA